MSSESYAESLEGVLKAARNAQPAAKNEDDVSNSRKNMLRSAALVAVLSFIDTTDERASTGRQMGSAWSQDHRRSAMGLTRLMESREKRSSWR